VPLLHYAGVTLATRRTRSLIVLLVATLGVAVRPSAAQDSAALARAGTQAIESRRFGDALAAFTKAATIRPNDPNLCFGAGIAAFMLGQDAVAQARFECALEINPQHLQAAMWLGDLNYRAGRLREAIAIYEAALRRTPENRELLQKLDEWRKEFELQRRFLDVRSEHFRALFENATDEPLAREVVERLEAAYWRVGGTLGVYPTAPITIVLYTREQFTSVTKLADWSVAAYDGQIRVPLAALQRQDDIDRVLSHEFVHALITSVGGRAVPAWLNEGLASVLEPAGSGDVEAMLGTAATPELTKLHRSFVDLSRRDAEVAYASSARAVRRLLDQHGAPALVALLQDLARGETFDRAFQLRIAMRYEEFAALLEQH